MIYTFEKTEETALMNAMSAMCAAARTAPKTKGQDFIHTLVLTGEEKNQVANTMREMGTRLFGENSWFHRDAGNLEKAGGLVLIGVENVRRGLPHCGLCGLADCDACARVNGTCAFTNLDLGIALGSAVSVAADLRVDSRIMFSVGKAAMELGFVKEGILWQGIPVSISGKSIFFDRK